MIDIENNNHKDNGKIVFDRAIEEERQYLARELHDGPAQDLYAAILLAGALASPEACTGQINNQKALELEDLLLRMTENIRKCIKELKMGKRPASLCAPEPKDIVSNIAHAYGITCRYSQTGKVGALKGQLRECMSPIINEVLSNAIRHGGATEIQVHLRIETDIAQLEIDDNGLGLGGAVTNQGALKFGDGIMNLNERANLCHGRINFSESMLGGSRFVLTVPRTNGSAD